MVIFEKDLQPNLENFLKSFSEIKTKLPECIWVACRPSCHHPGQANYSNLKNNKLVLDIVTSE